MTRTEHIKRHKELHAALDELAADYLRHNPGRYPSETPIMELLRWSLEQTIEPTLNPDDPENTPEPQNGAS